MDSKYQISSSKLEHIPIIEADCCVDLTPPKSDYPPVDVEGNESASVHRNDVKRYREKILTEILIGILALCFVISIVYLILASGRVGKISQDSSKISEAVLYKETDQPDYQNLHRFFYSDQASPELQEILSLAQHRSKRDAERSLCQQNMEHCNIVINSMRRIASIVNNSMPHLQAFLTNITDTGESKSEFMELVKCLQCKNDSITFIDESGPGNDHRAAYENSDRSQIENNIDIVTNLLDHDRLDKNEKDINSIFAETREPEVVRDYENIETSTAPFLDYRQGKNAGKIAEESQATSSTIKTTEYESLSAEVKVIDASMTSKAEEAAIRTNRIDDMEQTVNTTARVNVTETANEAAHPLVHPSKQGLAEESESKGEAGNGADAFRKSPYNLERRIVSSDRFQAKDSAYGIIPTAETMKSTQQLQLTPTMSLMPYQVCFYGPPPNGATTKQSASGQVIFPATSSGAPYSVPQQRQGPHLNQPPSYVQVQAQSVQFLPMQPYSGLPAGQRVGPTGPGMQTPAMYPGLQPPSSAGASASAKTPYYCTYIPTPTFQFPAIPGVSEYQRAAASSENNDTQSENKSNDQRSLVPGYSGPCPFNTIRCRDGSGCILRSHWCNGQVDCADVSDETSCSCRDRIAQERLCDGYFDCPHGEDELGCLGCPKTSFSCNDWNRRYSPDNCVPLSQRCDGIKQCANGRDEMDCNILTPTYIEGRNVFTIGYTEGYLHKNYMGQWYPVCTIVESWSRDACISEIGPEMSGNPEIKTHSIPDNSYQGPYLADVKGEMKLIPSCMNTAIYVRCPRIPCGTRAITNQDSVQPAILAKEIQDSLQPYTLSRSKADNAEDKEATEDNSIVGSQLRVVGGRASQPKAWPFLVAIYKDGRFYCGGVILNELWILTAAHCLDGYMGHYYEIHAGLLRRFSFSPMAQSRKARYTIVHPLYDDRDMSNDIGMIMLDEPLRFNRWVRTVCLPGPEILGYVWKQRPEASTTCIAIGWGATMEHGLDSDHLREVEVPILKDCKYENDQNDATICAGYPQGGRDACQGDSGGPLLCRNPYLTSQWYVAGIVSHGEGCGRPDEPGSYTKVSYFLEWIQQITGGGIPPLKRSPLEKCPGFSCDGGLGRCLPIEQRCNQIIDCLDGEDELNCHYLPDSYQQKQLRESSPRSDIVFDSSVTDRNSTEPESLSNSDTTSSSVTSSTLYSSSVKDQSSDIDDSVWTPDSLAYTTIDSLPTSTEAVTTFTCRRLLQSITIDKRCNRVADCEDSTDEMNCTCRDYLRNLKPAAICDGYLDCDDKTDEEDCEICSEDEFFCAKSRSCVAKSKRCDAQFDCRYKEDEVDCFTLTNGRSVYLDADGRPVLNMRGVLTRYVKGKWQPTCHRPRLHQNRSTATIIGQNMCEYFGFASLQSSETIIVNNSQLETVPWSTERKTPEEDPSATSPNDQNKTCSGLYIRCRPVLSDSLIAHLTVDAATGSHVYLWPWLAAIFVDGGYRCSAILLDRNWLLSAAKCVENIRLDQNYTMVVLGYGPLYPYIDGPHQQVSTIDELHHVNNSVSVLLHLKTEVNITRYVLPLFLEKTIYPPGVNDTCIATATDQDYETKSFSLRPVLQNCQSCNRCFVGTSILECPGNQTSAWSGTIFCHGRKGWYPAATFQKEDGTCDFRNIQFLTSIDYINPYLMEAMDGARSSIEANCDGFRCNVGQCISKERVCDGVPDCRDQRDEDPKYCEKVRQNCENSLEGCSCTRAQLRCRDGKCVDKSAFCDRKVDCSDASDEPLKCTCADYLKLTAPERLCDGVRHCLDKTDESPEICACSDSSFRCNTTSGNDFTCIPRDFVCDGTKDCANGEDEATCRMLKQPLDGSGGYGEVIRQSYGVWHTECFSSPLSSEEEASSICKTMGYSSGTISNDTIATDEPMVPERNNFHMVIINNITWLYLRDDKPLITLVKSDENCHRAFVDCV